MASGDNLQIVASISSLPRELVSEILALVAASSSTDLFQAKQCCKLLFEVSEENYIYQRVSLDKFPIVIWHENPRVLMFLNKCRQSKNPEALYRKGVVDYFGGRNPELALQCLQEAAKSEHVEAMYALGIICLFGGGELKQRGMTLLSCMKKSRIQKRRVKVCRKNLQRILRMIWVKNSVVLSQRPTCCNFQHQKRKRGWSADETDEEDNVNMCEGCTCEEEIEPIWDALPVTNYYA